MISIEEIRKLLLDSNKPLFMFDDDVDGLCSYLLLKRFAKKGNFVTIKSTPRLSTVFTNKVLETNPDKVFILDKPMIDQEFVDSINASIIWIDHHEPQKDIFGVKYFNPRILDDNDNRPTTHWCYKIVQQDEWIAFAGILSDWHMPEFAEAFSKEHPDLLPQSKDKLKALFDSKMGTLIRMLAFSLKGRTTEVSHNIRSLELIESPSEILDAITKNGKRIYDHFQEINKYYEKVLLDAIKKAGKDKVLLYTYPSTKHSFTGNLSNELIYRFPDKVIIIGREKEDNVVLSFRSSNIELPPLINEALVGLEGYGGGHKFACGGNIKKSDFPEFMNRFKNLVKQSQ